MTHYLYRLFDIEGDLLYVGVTAHPRNRMKAHRRREWGGRIDTARTRLCVFPTIDDAYRAEREVIRTERPRFNVVHNRPAEPRPPVRVRQWFIVRVYDAEGRVLKVGHTRHLSTWITGQRQIGREWVASADRIRMAGPYEKPVLRELLRSARAEVAA